MKTRVKYDTQYHLLLPNTPPDTPCQLVKVSIPQDQGGIDEQDHQEWVLVVHKQLLD